jgi:hypothetical protein
METNQENIFLSWTAPEFIYQEKGQSWFIVFGLIAATFLLLAIFMKNYFFAFIILIASFLIYIQAQKHPRKIKIEIFDDKIVIDKNLEFLYKDIVSFWIFEEPDLRILSLETKKFFQPKISLLLGGQDPSKIREVLKNFIKEKKQEEPFIDFIARKINF